MPRDDTSTGKNQKLFEEFGLGAYDYHSPEPIWTQPTHRRAIMASLVKGVYRMEKDRKAGLWGYIEQIYKLEDGYNYGGESGGGSWWSCRDKADLETMKRKTLVWWRTFHYEMVRPIAEEDGTLFGAVYWSHLHHNRGHMGAPQMVVAFRGTLSWKFQDFVADLHILFHRLGAHRRYQIGLQMVREELYRLRPNGGVVAIAGHSKGAALGLLIGRKLAEEGTFLEAHLFNPPHPTVPSDSRHVGTTISTVMNVVHNAVANGLSHVLEGEGARREERESFYRIRTWLPHLYVNANDPVCRAYIGYFEASRHLSELRECWFGFALSATPRSVRSVLQGSNPNCRPDHLVPSAYLHVHTPPRFASSFKANHEINQWLSLHLCLYPLAFRFDSFNDCMA